MWNKMYSKCLSIVLIIALMLSYMVGYDNRVAKATSKNQDEAIAWVKSQMGKGIDWDQAYGKQCVDLICAYYNYLGVKSPGGNGKDYATNTLPAGWNRYAGGAPQKGDILVYAGNASNPYGHVAIYESDRSHYHQNFNGHGYVEQVTYRYNGLSNPYWGCIRPNWNSSVSASITFSEYSLKSLSETNIAVYVKVLNPDHKLIQKAGCYLYNESGELIKRYDEDAGWSTSYMNFNMDCSVDMKYTLTKATNYKFQLFIIVDGREIKDVIRGFRTKGELNTPTPMSTPDVTPTNTPVTTNSPSSTPIYNKKTGGSALARVAEEEYKMFQGQEYNYKYGSSPWCCNFVTWVARTAEISPEVIVSTATVQIMYDSLVYCCGANVVSIPKRGDLVFYKYTDYDSERFHHIGIMTSSSESIQGNVNGTWWKGCPNQIKNVKEMVYVRPAYEVDDDTEQGGGEFTSTPAPTIQPTANPSTSPSATPTPVSSAFPSSKPTETPSYSTPSPTPFRDPADSQESQEVGKPPYVKGVKLKTWNSKLNVKWNYDNSNNRTGYQVQYALNNSFTKGRKTKECRYFTTNVTISKLKKKRYYVRVRGVNKVGGEKRYGKWSIVKSIKIKK